MSLRFFVDEDTPLTLVPELQRQGYDVVHGRHVGLLGKSDSEVLAFAREERRLLITRDLGFGDVRSQPPGSHCGIILLRVPTTFVASQIVELVSRFLADVDQAELPGALAVLRPSGYRIRREDQPG